MTETFQRYSESSDAEVPDAIMVSCVGDPDVFSLREHLKEKGMNKPVLDQCVSFGRGVINA